MLGRLFGGRSEQQDNIDRVTIERNSRRRKPEHYFRRWQIIDTQMGHGDAVADVTVTLVLLIRFVGTKLHRETSDGRAIAELIDDLRELSREAKEDFLHGETFRDHGPSRPG